MQKTSTTTTTTNKCKLNAKAFQKQNTVTTTTNKCKLNARAFQLEQNKCTSPPERVPIRTKLLQHERDLLTKSKIGKQILVFVRGHIEFVNPPYSIAIFASEEKENKEK